jgi:anti-sigma regulatory factor (Ser/Thr protein kinase)
MSPRPASASGEQVIDLRLPARAEAGRIARARLEPLRELMPPGDAFDDLLLAATELVVNAVVHSGLEPDGSIRVHVRRRPGTTLIAVEDDGCGFGRAEPRPADGSCGRGLMIVARLAARWGMERDGRTLVWCELEDPPPT